MLGSVDCALAFGVAKGGVLVEAGLFGGGMCRPSCTFNFLKKDSESSEVRPTP